MSCGGVRTSMRQLNDNQTRQQGFTLIEVMMAMVILGIGIMSIVALQTRDTMYNNSSRRQTQAYTWALDRVERLRALPYTDTDLTTSSHSESQSPYTVQWVVSDNTAKVADTKKVEVTVLWNGKAISAVTFTRTRSSI